jgi:hypothetical protein
MLSIIEEIQVDGTFHQSRTPDQFQEEIEVGFKEMDDSESCDPRCALVFLNHNVYCVAPASQSDTPFNDDMEKLCHGREETRILYDSLIMAKVSTGRGRGGRLFPFLETKFHVLFADVR